jgi:hypothetical protein
VRRDNYVNDFGGRLKACSEGWLRALSNCEGAHAVEAAVARVDVRLAIAT